LRRSATSLRPRTSPTSPDVEGFNYMLNLPLLEFFFYKL